MAATYMRVKREQAFLNLQWDLQYRTMLLEMKRPDCEKAELLRQNLLNELNESYGSVRTLVSGIINAEERAAVLRVTIRDYARAVTEVNQAASQAPLMLESMLKSA